MATTLLSNLVDPEVYAGLVDKKLIDAIKFAPLATIDTTLAGVPGSTVYLPSFSYIGSAEVLGENSQLTPVALNASTVSVSIYKVCAGVELTDESVLAGLGNPIEESAAQIVKSIADAMEYKIIENLHAISGTMLYQTSASTVDPADTDIADALELFGEDIDGTKVLLCPPAIYTSLRKNTNSWVPASEIAAGVAVRGVVGEYQGCQVMVTNRLKDSKEMYIVKPGALRIFLKRDTQVEVDRSITYFKTVITASKHFASYLYDASKAIRIAAHS